MCRMLRSWLFSAGQQADLFQESVVWLDEKLFQQLISSHGLLFCPGGGFVDPGVGEADGGDQTGAGGAKKTGGLVMR